VAAQFTVIVQLLLCAVPEIVFGLKHHVTDSEV